MIASIIIFCKTGYCLDSFIVCAVIQLTVRRNKKDDKGKPQSDPKTDREIPREPCGHRDVVIVEKISSTKSQCNQGKQVNEVKIMFIKLICEN